MWAKCGYPVKKKWTRRDGSMKHYGKLGDCNEK